MAKNLRGVLIPAPFQSVVEAADGARVWLSGGVCLDLEKGARVGKAPKQPAGARTGSVQVQGRTIAGSTWKSRPFTKTPIDRIVDASLDAAGTSVLVRAESWDDGGLVRLIATARQRARGCRG